MSSAIVTRSTQALDSLAKQWASAPIWARLATLLALPAAGAFLATLNMEYHKWMAMGPGGLPANRFGFLVNQLVTLFMAKGSKSTKDLKPYDDPLRSVKGWQNLSEREQANALKSFLSEPLRERRGQRTRALPFVIPQRERSAREYQVPKVKEVYSFNIESVSLIEY
jgi:hypothetical protein